MAAASIHTVPRMLVPPPEGFGPPRLGQLLVSKGYITEEHAAALTEHGPSPVHRMRFVNVRRAAGIIDPEPLSLEPQLELFEPEAAYFETTEAPPVHLETPVTLQEVST